jgi:hypothetical protein
VAKSKNALAIPTALTSEVGIDKDDLVAIKVARVETHLIKQQAEQDTLLRDLKKRLKTVRETLDKKVEEAGKTVYDPTEAVKALKALGIKVEADVTARALTNDKKLEVQVSLKKPDSSYGGGLSASKKVAIPKAVKTAQEAVEKVEAEIEEVQVKLVDIRKRLSQIGTLERQAKAHLALEVLKGSEEGRALIKAIEETEGLPDVPGLPSPK